MTLDTAKAAKEYSDRIDNAADVVSEAMLQTYKLVVGRDPSDNLVDDVKQIIRMRGVVE